MLTDAADAGRAVKAALETLHRELVSTPLSNGGGGGGSGGGGGGLVGRRNKQYDQIVLIG